jgi:hypothetical protein
MEKQHLALWRGPCSTQSQELISGPDLATRARLLYFNRTQSRVVIGLLTGRNTLRRHLYIMGLCNNATCRKCGTEEETSVHVMCECEALASLRHTYLGLGFVVPCIFNHSNKNTQLDATINRKIYCFVVQTLLNMFPSKPTTTENTSTSTFIRKPEAATAVWRAPDDGHGNARNMLSSVCTTKQ